MTVLNLFSTKMRPAPEKPTQGHAAKTLGRALALCIEAGIEELDRECGAYRIKFGRTGEFRAARAMLPEDLGVVSA